MVVFSDFVGWALVMIGLIHLTLVLLSIREKLPQPINLLLAFIAGAGTIFSVLELIHTGPLALIGLIASFFFGLSLHVFVPLLMALAFIFYYFRFKNKSERIAFIIGLGSAMAVVIVFLIQWASVDHKMHKAQVQALTHYDNELPQWVIFSQQWPDSYFGKLIMEGNLIYDEPLFQNNFNFGNSFDDTKKHDPLVLLATTIFGDISMDETDRIKILESQFDARHKAHRKLWSGRNLVTQDVITHIKVDPAHRLAYQEKTITIKNDSRHRWRSSEEAVYTFHIPDGAFVTSLSLWVNGKEEKSRLTTKGKADSAYVNIVGVQRRDPALLHWQEGNRISVTVFPCTPQENRMFKVGFTTPLEERNDQLILKNIYFEGPSVDEAIETTVLDLIDAKMPASHDFDQTDGARFERTGNYQTYWELAFDKPEISEDWFSFNGKSYHITSPILHVETFDPEEVYLDLNEDWTENDINEILSIFKDKEVYAITSTPQLIQGSLPEYLEEQLLTNRFSLFPFQKIKSVENSLVITKNSGPSPNLNDMKDSKFIAELKEFIESGKKPKVFLIGKEWPAYLATLNQFGVFQALQGNISDLKTLADSRSISIPVEDSATVYLAESNVSIVLDSNEKAKSDAPDHILRFFNYNRILDEIGNTYFYSDQYSEGHLIDMANEAYVASPISSLIVLETQKDYERFDIEKNKNSLNNAQMSSSGAVPEPHEWALIIFTIITVLVLTYKRRFA